jgi:hypothetical protein
MKKCTRCQTEKENSEFRKSTRGPLSSWCRQCEREYQREIYKKNPFKRKERANRWMEKYAVEYSAKRKIERQKYYASEIARKYKISKQEAQRLIDTEGSMCKACGICFDMTKPLLRRNLDHCHTTGKIRGFLCSRCNTVAGFVNDETEILEKISNYLKKCITT